VKDTVPVTLFESEIFIPPTSRLTPLAMAALENGVCADDVRAYLSFRYAARLNLLEVLATR